MGSLRRALACALSLGLVWGSSPALAEGYHGTGTTAAAPHPIAPILAQLPDLPVADRISRVEQLAATDPAARVLAAVAAEPRLLEERRERLAALVGEENLPALTAAVVKLHVEARGDESTLERLAALAGSTPPRAVIDQGRWYDSALRASPGAPLEPALVRSESGDGAGPRVLALSASGARLLVNGSPAESHGDLDVADGLARERLVHPDDPSLRVKVYHSPGSLEAFERREAKAARLRALGRAGAAPKLIETGEAVLEGRGRAYFFVQELLEGAALADLPAVTRPLGEVAALFDRLKAAGLALQVPGPDLSWLFSRVMIGATASGGRRAYLLDGDVRPLEGPALERHYGMLAAMLDSASRAQAPETPAPRVAALIGGPAARSKAWVARADGSLETLSLESAKAVAALLPKLLAEPGVLQVLVHPDARGAAERAGNKDLHALLKLMPESPERDALILGLAGPVWAQTAAPDVLRLLALLSVSADVDALPLEAWRALGAAELESLIAARRAAPSMGLASARRWLEAREASLGEPGLTGGDLARLLSLLPDGPDRNAFLLRLPREAWPKFTGPQTAELLALVDNGQAQASGAAVYKALPHPGGPWERLSLEDAAALAKSRGSGEAAGTSAVVVMERWLGAHAEDLAAPGAPWRDVVRTIEELPSVPQRHELLAALPAHAYTELGGSAVAALLKSLWGNVPQLYDKAPDAAWIAMGRDDVLAVAERWRVEQPRTELHAARLWIRRQARWSELFPVAERVAWGMDSLIPEIRAEAWASAPSREVARLLAASAAPGVEGGSPFWKIPSVAWSRLELADLSASIETWGATRPGQAAAMLERWLAVNADKIGKPGATGKQLYEAVRLLPESESRDELIARLPGFALASAIDHAKTSSEDFASTLMLVSRGGVANIERLYGKVTQDAWRALERFDAERLVRYWLGHRYSGVAAFVARRWLEQHPGGENAERLVSLTPVESAARDALIAAIPPSTLETLSGAQVAGLIAGMDEIVEEGPTRLPPEAWRRLEAADVSSLLSAWTGPTRLVIVREWMSARKDSLAQQGPQFGALLRRVAESGAKSSLAAAVPAQGWAALSSDVALSLLYGAGGTQAELVRLYEGLPPEAWRALSHTHARGLAEYASAQSFPLAGLTAARLWLRHAHSEPSRAPTAAQVAQVAAALSGPLQRAQALAALPDQAYAAMTSPQAAALLELLVRAANPDVTEEVALHAYKRLPRALWERLDWRDLAPLLRPSNAHILRHLWLEARVGEPAAAAFLREAIEGVTPHERARWIEKIPGPSWAAMPSADAAGLLSLASVVGAKDPAPFYEKLPAEAWRALSATQAREVVERARAATHPAAAQAAATSWLRQAFGDPERAPVAQQLVELVGALPQHRRLGEALSLIPDSEFLKMTGTQAAALLRLDGPSDAAAEHVKEAWRRNRP